MTAAVIPLADAALSRCRRYREMRDAALALLDTRAAERWQERASRELSRAYDVAPNGWVPKC